MRSLFHGAIIAKEYGIPCVTGIARATDYIETGRNLTMGGYLGIVILE
jgi:phosphohistidine swiveling domain-containing protein